MAHCKWCGKNIPEGEGDTRGPRWNRRYYCSMNCAMKGENNLTDKEKAEDNISFGRRMWRFFRKLIIIAVIIMIIILIMRYLQ